MLLCNIPLSGPATTAKCPHCEKVITGRKRNINGNLKRHINTVHLKLKPFKCCYCEKMFGEKSNKQSHERTVHSVELCGIKDNF